MNAARALIGGLAFVAAWLLFNIAGQIAERLL